ncbi:MAG: hypothetical protein KAI67_05415, partial [Candidatus Pacebacteria bacterium]|nr:hypothetical protein [Candidatus Paceibacterota bacterium]
MIEKNDKINFILLHDEAANEDYFEDQTHDKLANTLKNLISNEDNGSTIALEGTWGSGKSVVISILQKKLEEKENNISFFVFDAWAHEGDPLRRVFLESLINKLKENENIDFNELECLETTISKRKKIIKTTTKRTVTKFGRIIAFSTLLVPLGMAWMSTIKDVEFIRGGEPHWGFIISTMFTSAPLIIVFFKFIMLLIDKYARKVNLKISDVHNWDFLESDTTEDVAQEISEDEERSSIEFEKYFGIIMDRVFSSNKIKKFVIVIDNLDRVDSEDALKIWSTLQTFLQQRGKPTKTKVWFKKIWIIVPVDPEGLSRIWKDKNDGKPSEEYSKSFFDKCFQLRLEVPKPILTGWEKFAKKMIDKSLESWEPSEREHVMHILKLTREDVSDIPTPREIKNYINQVGLLRMHANEAIQTPSLAYYAIYRYIKEGNFNSDIIRKQLIKQEMPKKEHAEFLPDTCSADCAGLLFGVTTEKGQQLLLEPEIRNSLVNENYKKLKELKESHKEGFWAVFEHHITNVNFTYVLALPYTKAIYQGLYDENSSKCKKYIRRLCNFVENNDAPWPIESTIESYECLVKLIGEAYNTKKALHRTLMVSLLNRLICDDKFDYSKNINLLERIKVCFTSDISAKEIKTVSALDKLISWSKKSLSTGAETWKWIKPTETVAKDISLKIIAGQPIADGTKEIIEYTICSGVKNNWKEVIASCKKHIFHNNGTFVANKHSNDCFEIIMMIAFSDIELLKDVLGIVKSGQFFNLLYYTRKHTLEYAALICAYSLKDELHTYNATPTGHSNAGIMQIRTFWTQSNEANANKVVTLLKKYKMSNMIWKMIGNTANKLLIDIIEKIVTIDERDFFKVTDALKKLKAYSNLIGDEAKRLALVEKFITYSNIEEEVINNDNLSLSDYSKNLYLLVLRTKNQKVLEKLIKELEGIQKEAWKNAFVDDTGLTSLGLEINKKKQQNLVLKNDYLDGMIEFLKEVNKGKQKLTDWQKENWNELFFLLGENFQIHYRNKITAYFIEEELDLDGEIYRLN